MNSALAASIEGKSDLADWRHRNARSPDDVTKGLADTLNAQPRGPHIKTFNDRVPPFCQSPDSQMENPAPAAYFESNLQEAVTDDSGEPPDQTPINSHMPQDEQYQSESVQSSKPILEHRAMSADSKEPTSPAPSSYTKENTHASDLPTRIRATATSAASLIQKSVGADGVLFLYATVGSAGSLIDNIQGLSQTETETDGPRTSDASLEQVRSPHHREGDCPSNEVLGPCPK